MRLAVFIVACVLSGCAGSSLRPVNAAEVAAPAGVDAASVVVRDEWARRLGVDLGEGTPRVVWFAGDRLRYEGQRDAYLSSVYWPGSGEIHVAVMAGRPSDGGFVHEMLHWALWRSLRLADAQHAHPAWAEVHDVRAILRERGL